MTSSDNAVMIVSFQRGYHLRYRQIALIKTTMAFKEISQVRGRELDRAQKNVIIKT